MHKLRRIAGHPLVKASYFLLLVVATGFYLYRWGDRLPDLLAQVRPLWVLAALGITGLAALLYSFIQYSIYKRLGAPVSYWTTLRIISISQLGKYLPGKVMFAGNYYLLSREAGISNAQVGTSFVVSQALWMLTASLCGLPVLALLNPVLRYTVILLPVGLALLIHPRFLSGLLRLAQRISGRGQSIPLALPQGLGGAFYLRMAALYLINWILAGAGGWFSLRALGPVDPDIFPLALAALALGTIAGFIALFAPVGLGVREGLGTIILAPAVGAEVALLGLVLLRGVTVVLDLSLALLSLASRARQRVF